MQMLRDAKRFEPPGGGTRAPRPRSPVMTQSEIRRCARRRMVESGNRNKPLERTTIMNDRNTSELNMLVRSCKFVADNPLLPPSTKATGYAAQMVAAKDAVLATGVTWEEGQGSYRAATANRHAVIADLREKLKELSLTAKALNRLGTHPGIQQQFRMPGRKMQDLRDRAGAFATAAAEPDVKQAFIDHDSAATFVEDLEAAIEAFDDATDDRFAGSGKRIGATAGIRATLRDGITAVRAMNTILVKRYRDNPAKLTEWKAAQRIAAWPSQPAAPAPPPPVEGSGSGAPPTPTDT